MIDWSMGNGGCNAPCPSQGWGGTFMRTSEHENRPEMDTRIEKIVVI